ncbi:MAG TPA: alpha/beta hydrolase [Candidatus Hydrogenedentes bacterium]|nr:alpha/beta hydrolase [Candidatus Hydrogenedentota bacterium]HOL76020.1 alpha/beta hydrolase [Candidatus Hydrogenedentota bacterium]HPO84634.1 alpha/beta hydrolase [Candidatus Hydrogenedentota bacterium]
MYVEKQGEGRRTFVGIHGWAGNHRTFRRLMPFLPDDACFYSLDLPGYGSSPPPREWTFLAVCDQLELFLKELHEKPLTLVGNCGGALFAVELAKRLSADVGRIVLIDPFAFAPLYFRVFTWGTFGRYAYFSTFANPIGRWFTNSALYRRRSAQANLTSAFTTVNHETAHRYICLMCSIRSARIFGNVSVPADIVYGERTFKAVRASLPIWRETLPSARFHELKGAGHEPLREATKALSQVIFEYDNDAIALKE